jgi:hypothetical protein
MNRSTSKVMAAAAFSGALALVGCGASRAAVPLATASTSAVGASGGRVTAFERVAAPATVASEATALGVAAALPADPPQAAPWSGERLPARAAPRPLLSAWQRADNRAWCAPLAPSTLGGVGAGARPRQSAFAGGWAVEFDKQGAPGVTGRGEACATCGRGSFGIAGTSLTADGADELIGAGARPFTDGGRIAIQDPGEEPVAVATLVVGGQDCVYQVWSFLGREHLDELVAGLRLVDAR